MKYAQNDFLEFSCTIVSISSSLVKYETVHVWF